VAIGEIHIAGKNRHGKWVARAWETFEDGRPRKGIHASAPTQKAAKAALRERLDRLTTSAEETFTMDDLMQAYQTNAERRGKPSEHTRLDYLDTYRAHIKPVFGSKDAAKITRQEINQFLTKMDERRRKAIADGKRPTANPRPVYDCLLILLKELMMLGRVAENMARGSFVFSESEPDPRALTPEEIDQLEAAFKAHAEYLTGKDRYPRTLLTAFAVQRDTGMRIGEVCALRARDFDPQRGTLTVAGTMTDIIQKRTRNGELVDGETTVRKSGGKTESATRTVVLPRSRYGVTAYALLVELKKAAPGPDAPLIPARGGKFLRPNALRARWRKAVAMYAPTLSDVVPHDLRASVATQIVRGAVKRHGYYEGMERARKQLGHASFAPMKHYLSRTDDVVDNSDLLGAMNPENARAEEARATIERTARAQGLSVKWVAIDGNEAAVLLEKDAESVEVVVSADYSAAVLIIQAVAGERWQVIGGDDERIRDRIEDLWDPFSA